MLVVALVAVGILHLLTSGGGSQPASPALASPPAASEAPDGPPKLESLATASDERDDIIARASIEIDPEVSRTPGPRAACRTQHVVPGAS